MLGSSVRANLRQNFQPAYLGNIEVEQNEHWRVVVVARRIFTPGKQIVECFNAIVDANQRVWNLGTAEGSGSQGGVGIFVLNQQDCPILWHSLPLSLSSSLIGKERRRLELLLSGQPVRPDQRKCRGPCGHFGRFGYLQTKIKGCPLFGLCFRPDESPVFLNDAVYGGQTDPSSGKLGLGMQALKHAEKLARIPHIKTGTIVSHQDNHRFTRLLNGIYFDHRGASARGIFRAFLYRVLKTWVNHRRSPL